MVRATDQLLEDMVDSIVREVDPQRIVLFGSYARGEAEADSDIDFLIVQDRPFEPGRGRRQQMAQLWRLLARFPISQDILIYTPDEVERWCDTQSHVVARALREGKVLYERS